MAKTSRQQICHLNKISIRLIVLAEMSTITHVQTTNFGEFTSGDGVRDGHKNNKQPILLLFFLFQFRYIIVRSAASAKPTKQPSSQQVTFSSAQHKLWIISMSKLKPIQMLSHFKVTVMLCRWILYVVRVCLGMGWMMDWLAGAAKAKTV